MEARRFCFLYNFCHYAGQRARRIPVYLHRRRAARACSSTIPIPTFAKKHCSKSCGRRSSWRTTMASRSTRTTCARAPCRETRSCCARRLRRSAVFLFINVLRHFTAQRAVSQIPKGFILLKKGLCKTQNLFSGITRRKRYHRKMRTEGSDQTDLIVQNGCRKNFRFTLDNIGYIPYTDYRI